MSKDEFLWDFSVAADRYRESKRDLERGEAIFSECWHGCPPDNHPQAPTSNGGVGYDYTLCPVHGPELDELNQRTLAALAVQEWEGR